MSPIRGGISRAAEAHAPLRQITRSLDLRARSEADIAAVRYVQPLGDAGLHVVKLPCNEAERVVSGPAETFAPGSQVLAASVSGRPGQTIVSPAPPGRRGGASFATAFPIAADVDVYGIRSADPNVLARGTTDTLVTLSGYGFRASPVDLFSAVVWSESARAYVADPFLTLHDAAWISSTRVTVLADLDAAAPIGYRMSVLVLRAG